MAVSTNGYQGINSQVYDAMDEFIQAVLVDRGLGSVNNTGAFTPIVGGAAVIDLLTSTDPASGLSANMGNFLAVNKIWWSNGVPGAGLGQNGDVAIRFDAPFEGALYQKAAGAWAPKQTVYTVATLPAAALATLGAIAHVVDTTYAPAGIDLECMTYDGGTTYWWVPTSKVWRFYNKSDKDTAQAGTNTNVTAFTFTTPNRTDIFMPGTELWVSIEGQGVGSVGSRTFDVSAAAMNGGSSSLLTQVTQPAASAGASFWARSVIHITAANTGFSHPFTAYTSNVSSVVNTTYSGANWANLAIAFRKNGSSASDTVQVSARNLTLTWPDVI